MIDLRTLMRALGGCSPEERDRVFAKLSASDQRALSEAWGWQARDGQLEPAGPWDFWLILAGRGWGKTRTGAEWVLKLARDHPEARIALVGASLDEAARVMVEGESGLIACAGGERLDWRPTKSELRFPSKAVAQLYSGASPDGLRGPQHNFAWADELGKWLYPERTWDMLNMGLRLGDWPRALITTTPKPLGLLRRLWDDAAAAKSGGRTFDNPFLPGAFLDAMERRYSGSRLGRQELDGELLGEAAGALWTRATIEACRCAPPVEAEIRRVVVGVDPPAGTADEEGAGDECGILVCALLADGRGVVLADCTTAGLRPEGWARAVAAAATGWRADRVVAEANNGGQMVDSVLRAVAPGLPLSLVHASRGKSARAEPVAALFEARRCLLAGTFPALEDQMTAMTPGGYTGAGSPDRLDAMVWALTKLVANAPPDPRVRGL